MSAEIARDILELEKLRQEIGSELAKRHNWAEQEQFWRANADFWTLAHRQDRLRNWIAIAAVVAGIAGTLGIAIGKFAL